MSLIDARFLVIYVLWIVAAATTHAAPFCTVTDDNGYTITIQQPVKRIVSLAPDLTETLFAIGAGNHVIGTIRGADYPDAARYIPRVGSSSGIDVEKILALKPDLIVTWGTNFSSSLELFRKIGLPVFISRPTQLDDIPHTMRRLGCLAGTDRVANKAAHVFLSELTALTVQPVRQRVNVFFQLNASPLMTINGESWINQVIERCGGYNIFKMVKIIAPVVSREAVVISNPDVILSDILSTHWQQEWQRFPNVSAVRHQRLASVPPDWIDRAGPRLVLGARRVCEVIHRAAVV